MPLGRPRLDFMNRENFFRMLFVFISVRTMHWHKPALRFGSANPNDSLRAPRTRLGIASKP
jgi:hypothetical protein